jgi:hypothetical protein
LIVSTAPSARPDTQDPALINNQARRDAPHIADQIQVFDRVGPGYLRLLAEFGTPENVRVPLA